MVTCGSAGVEACRATFYLYVGTLDMQRERAVGRMVSSCGEVCRITAQRAPWPGPPCGSLRRHSGLDRRMLWAPDPKQDRRVWTCD